MPWGWVKHGLIFIFEWTNPLIRLDFWLIKYNLPLKMESRKIKTFFKIWDFIGLYFRLFWLCEFELTMTVERPETPSKHPMPMLKLSLIMKGTIPPTDAAIRPAFSMWRPGSSREAESNTPEHTHTFILITSNWDQQQMINKITVTNNWETFGLKAHCKKWPWI